VAPFAWGAMGLLFPAPSKMTFSRLGGYAAVYGAYFLARAQALGSALKTVVALQSNPLLGAGPWERVLGAGRIFLERYLAGVLEPGRRLYDCSARECGPSAVSDPLGWVGLGVALVAVLSPLLLRRRSRLAAAGMAWFVLFFLPVSNLVVLSPSIYAERLLYLPMLGLNVALVAAVAGVARRLRHPALAWVLLCAWGLANLVALQVRHLDWRTSDALYASGLELAPNSALVQLNIASALLNHRQWEAAAAHARRSLDLWPDNPSAHSVLGIALDELGRSSDAEEEFRLGFESRSKNCVVVTDYTTFLARHGNLAKALRVGREDLTCATVPQQALRAMVQKIEQDLAAQAKDSPSP
jgi:hypothetical protein